MSVIQELTSLLSSPKRIAITMHRKPDADAIGASLGLYHFLIQGGHQVSVVSPTDYPDFLKWMPGSDSVLIGPFDPDKANWIFDGADIIFCLDFNALNRLADFEQTVRDSDAMKIMIDHHMEPEGFEDLSYSDEKASSTAELIYRLITEMGQEEKVNLASAEALYAGIMTDTGSFRFTNTSPATHKTVAKLMEIGVNVNMVWENIFNTATPERLRFVGHCLSSCLHVLPELKVAYLKVDREVFRQFPIKTGDTEGLVNYALSLKGVNMGVLLTANDEIIKLSFRSRGNVSSKEFAENFGGGGHFYAAGGRSTLSMEETEKRFLELLEENKDKLLA